MVKLVRVVKDGKEYKKENDGESKLQYDIFDI
jgi:hypothetical protein